MLGPVGAAGPRPSRCAAIPRGYLLAKLLDAYAAEPGAVEVDVTLCGPGEQERVLRDGRADVALLHRPFDATDGYDTEELAEEGQALFLPAGHPLAGRTELRTADIADLPLPRWPRPDGGFSPGEGPQVHDSAQLQQLVMLGRAVAVLPDSVRAGLPEGIVAVPVVDAARVTTLLAWPPQSRVRGLADLVRVASRL